MNKGWKIIEKILFYFLAFLLPTQLAFHFWPTSSFVFGIRVDYLSPTIFLTDVLILALVLPFIVTNWSKILILIKRHYFFILTVLFLILSNIIKSQLFFPTMFKWLKIIELTFFVYYLSGKGKEFSILKIIKAIYYSIISFSVLGIAQVINNGTLGSFFYYLGERSFNIQTPGIALASIFGNEFMRAYSTFPHPNSFAGYLTVCLILIVGFSKYLPKGHKILLLIPILAIVMCFSLSSIVSIVLVLLVAGFVYRKNVVFGIIFFCVSISLVLPIFSKVSMPLTNNLSSSVSQRLSLSLSAQNLISDNFIFGVGLNNFIPNSLENLRVSGTHLLLQPVHNIYLLVTAETGIVGLVLFGYFIFHLMKYLLNSKQTYLILCVLFILLSGLFDHYWITLQQNMLLLSLLVGVSLFKHKSDFT